MKKSLLVFVLFLAQNLVFAQKNFIDQPYIETSAKADSLVTPDRIYLNITIQEADSKNKKSVEEQEQAMESVLKKLGINTQKDLTLENAISYFKNYTFRGQNVLKSKSFSLLVKDAVTAGKVLMELEKINISNTNISRVEYSKTEALQLELKTKALLKTKQNAQKILTPIGQKVGKALHISENNYSHSYDAQPMMMYKTMAVESESSPEPIDIDIKKIKISAEVFAKYAIE